MCLTHPNMTCMSILVCNYKYVSYFLNSNLYIKIIDKVLSEKRKIWDTEVVCIFSCCSKWLYVVFVVGLSCIKEDNYFVDHLLIPMAISKKVNVFYRVPNDNIHIKKIIRLTFFFEIKWCVYIPPCVPL